MFQPRFQTAVVEGRKKHTIRPKARCKPGDELSLRKWKDKPYRSLQLPLLPTVICTAVKDVRIFPDIWVGGGFHIMVNRAPVVDLDAFAREDGFKDADDLRAWFEQTHDLPFEGELIEWK
ncbi:MAG: ASCH domain-containing protein [Prosthecobacter sp.]|nr:ASCH domain-containing protein [Prosthecobacter sp.]